MRFYLFLLTALICMGCQATPAITFPTRPRVAMTATELAAWRQAPERQREIDQQRRKADNILEQGLHVPQEEGQWIFYYACPDDNSRLKAESPTRHVCPTCDKVYDDERTVAAYRTILNNQLNRQLYELALAYALTDDTRYAEAARDAMLELARVYPTLQRHDRWGRWGLLAIVGGRRYCQHLSEGIGAMEVAKAYDLCADAPVFTDEQRRTIEQDFLGATAREIRSYAWMMQPRNNHQTWFNATYATVGMAIGDAELLHDAIHGDHGLMWQLDVSVTEDGLWYEGTMAYHFYALQAMIETLEVIEHIGWRFPSHEALKSLWLGPLRTAWPDGSFPAINDSDPGNLASRAPAYAFAHRYFGDERFADFTSQQQVASTNLAGSGLAVLRRGTGDDAVCAMLDYGIHGDHHGHPDKLNLMLYAHGQELILDPGRLSYRVPEYESWARTTVAHNTIVIDEANQQPDEGTLPWFVIEPDYVACLAETRGAYPGTLMRRGLLLTDNWLADIVTVEAKKASTIDWLVHCRGELQPVGAPVAQPPFRNRAGYQHLEKLQAHPDSQRFHFQLNTERALHVTAWPALPGWSGVGLGYQLTDQVPFMLRRATGTSATFITIYSWRGPAEMAEVIETADGTIRFRVNPTHTIELTADPAELHLQLTH